ncbi:MAG: hypothetical protein ACI4EA_12285 [Candidatus Ornithomonoglobus sp.]
MNCSDEYKELICQSPERAKRDAAAMRAALENSTAHYHGNTVHTLYIPQMYTQKDYDRFKEIADSICRILDKIIKEYIKNPEYRELFGFGDRINELILRPSLYECLIPVMRIDLFYNHETGGYKFCEFNTDGSSGMNEDRELNNVFRASEVFGKLCEKHKITVFELFDSFTEEFTKIYKASGRYRENAHVAIADFMSSASVEEFEEFKKSFERQGYSCEICDIYSLKRKDGRLIAPSGRAVDAVYRRAVTCDILSAYDEILPFIEAAKNNEVVLIGDFKTQIAHNKLIFEIMHDDMTKRILTDEENSFIREHIPKTYKLTAENIKKYDIEKNRCSWIVKPADSYASKGVFAGIEAKTDQEWIEFIKKHADTDYLMQEYIHPYETENIDLLWDENACFAKYCNITGLFIYNGRLRGLYSRVSKTGIISTQYSEMTLPTVLVD